MSGAIEVFLEAKTVVGLNKNSKNHLCRLVKEIGRGVQEENASGKAISVSC